MRLQRWLASGALLIAACSGAAALDESEVKVGPTPVAPGIVIAPTDNPRGTGLTIGTKESDGTPALKGTEIRIPGLGTIGTIPKFDFGLELLYGASEVKPAQKDLEADELRFRGTIKHRF